MIVFDTSAVIDFLRKGKKTREILQQAEDEGTTVATTTISLFEILSPIVHRRLRVEEKILRAFFRQTTVLGFDFQAAEEASKVMGGLLKIGRPINALDAMICGIALSNNVEYVVTKDRDFQEAEKVSDIKVTLI